MSAGLDSIAATELGNVLAERLGTETYLCEERPNAQQLAVLRHITQRVEREWLEERAGTIATSAHDPLFDRRFWQSRSAHADRVQLLPSGDTESLEAYVEAKVKPRLTTAGRGRESLALINQSL